MPILKNCRHEAFARAIVRGSSATAAYIEAGYSRIGAQPGGSRLLSKGIISARILELKTQAAVGAVATSRQVLEELTKLALANAADYVNADAAGSSMIFRPCWQYTPLPAPGSIAGRC
jgi:phage terminase small subunit